MPLRENAISLHVGLRETLSMMRRRSYFYRGSAGLKTCCYLRKLASPRARRCYQRRSLTEYMPCGVMAQAP